MRITVNGRLPFGCAAKDLILAIIGRIGTAGGTGHVIEYAGEAVRSLSMEGRMTVCNMSIEGGARCGYINPDAVSIEYLRGRQYSPEGATFERAAKLWRSLASDPDADYADRVEIDGSSLAPAVTWGINPGQNVAVDERLPRLADTPREEQAQLAEAFEYMGLTPGDPLEGTPIDVAFIGSCTNGRISDLREAARVAKTGKVASGVRALVVPGSQAVARQAEEEGLPEIFRAAGFQWRQAGCSMCLAMNPDKLIGREMAASSSNRNFKGRQGSPTGRTLLMSPAMVAAAALRAKVTDVREIL
jgi:3-isopropylmalate/(R)-2-methylmalate dehydratase large subunit